MSSYLMNISPDFKEDIKFLLEFAQLQIKGVGTAHLWHDIKATFNFFQQIDLLCSFIKSHF